MGHTMLSEMGPHQGPAHGTQCHESQLRQAAGLCTIAASVTLPAVAVALDTGATWHTMPLPRLAFTFDSHFPPIDLPPPRLS